MSYLLDTNVLSELRRKCPDPHVVSWLEQRPAHSLYLSVLTVGEIRHGVENVTDLPRRQALQDWLEHELPSFFAGRILPINDRVADCWGRLLAEAGRPVAAVDSLLAATAVTHGLTLVTRNVKDFRGIAAHIINPWER